MFQGVYINLKRNSVRQQNLCCHLEQRGILDRYARFEAIDGSEVYANYNTGLTPGVLGCWLSHLNAAKTYRDLKMHLHIIEDDTFFSLGIDARLDALIRMADQSLGNWDLLFTDLLMPIDLNIFCMLFEKMKLYRNTGQSTLINLERINFTGMGSYIINNRSLEKYIDLMDDNWRTNMPIDLFVPQLVMTKRLTAYCTFPFLTRSSQDGHKSDIDNQKYRIYNILDVYRRGGFIDADYDALLTEMAKLSSGILTDPFTFLFLKTLNCFVSDCVMDDYWKNHFSVCNGPDWKRG